MQSISKLLACGIASVHESRLKIELHQRDYTMSQLKQDSSISFQVDLLVSEQ